MRTRSLGTSLLICWGFFAGAVAAAEQLTPAADATAIEGPERTGSVPRIVTDPPQVDRIAQERPSFEWRDYSLRVAPTAVPPVIDGSLGDAAWENAPVISDFTQVEPREGAQPSERTEVRLLYDANNLYVAVRCFQDATRIRGTQMQHDADLSSDDYIALIFDTFGRKRSGYIFKTNPAGAKQEGLVDAKGGINSNWDAIWLCRCRRDVDGWTAEIAIPFRSLSFDPATSVWGFNVERTIRWKQEVVRWAFPFQNKSISSLADVGRLQGLSGIHQGLGLEITPFLVGRYRDERDGRNDHKLQLEPSLDAFYHITPSLTAALTINTDFAETEVDARQVNLTRFPLFLPEKRAFFLADANLFGFSTYNGPQPFYSRRIGLSPNGETVDIIAGTKLAGRIGNLEVGVLDVQQGASSTDPEANLGVARLSYRVLGESSVGAIFTHGGPQGTDDNWLVGSDLNYRNSHIAGNNLLTAQGWFLRSDEAGVDGRQLAFGGNFTFPNEPFWIEAGAAQIDPDFNPGLGFVSRTGIRDYRAYTRYRFRPEGYIRTIDVEFTPEIITDLNDKIETEYWTVPSIVLLNQRGDQLTAGFVSERERLVDPFEIQPGVVIAPGDYRFNRGYVTLSSTAARPLSAYGSVDIGDFYNGSSEKLSAGLEWRPSSRFFFSVQSELDVVDLPSGSFDVVVSSARLNFTFSPDVSWNTLVQYDNTSNEVGVYSRFKWTLRPGSDLYLVFKNGFDVEDGRFRAKTTEISTKFGYTLRF